MPGDKKESLSYCRGVRISEKLPIQVKQIRIRRTKMNNAQPMYFLWRSNAILLRFLFILRYSYIYAYADTLNIFFYFELRCAIYSKLAPLAFGYFRAKTYSLNFKSLWARIQFIIYRISSFQLLILYFHIYFSPVVCFKQGREQTADDS